MSLPLVGGIALFGASCGTRTHNIDLEGRHVTNYTNDALMVS